ncbi:hypothetical protein EHR03_13225 [Leptospira mayottensis]|uniref:Peptidase C39-like domain-containing protein n=1 Tax=Leptospira mayottensis 200901116 TaxID=1192864 RepID=M6V6M3_9LEPT|nr:hypothetical protein [Leptospira mayottensis]AVH81544.1 hypothetical protein [Leptospira mayottensis 200901116]TGN00382.1 hypothetical protein EHR03_13225 [Leptospira mayottensis]
MIQEGLRKIEKEKYNLTKNDFVLNEAWHYTQKDNRNIDGSSNMVYTKEWRRFNQCFISSGTAFINKLLDSLIKSGLDYKASGRIDELSYLIRVGEYNTGESVENNKRFFWEQHRKFLNQVLSGAFPDASPIPCVDYSKVGIKSLNKLAYAILLERQPMAGIHLGNGGGHIITIIGYRVDQSGKIIGLWVSDPAGIYTEGYSKPLDGFMSYLPEKVFKDIFRTDTHMMDLAK